MYIGFRPSDYPNGLPLKKDELFDITSNELDIISI